MKNEILRFFVHLILPTRNSVNNFLKKISSNFIDADILEIGSGLKKRNASAVEIFGKAREFQQTDVDVNLGYKILDLTNIESFNKEYDLVICTNVLEHIYDVRTAVKNLYKLVKKEGNLIISVPFMYPLHDEPEDFWRFTEHSLKKLFENFEIITLKKTGLRQLPLQYIMHLKKL